MRPFRQVDVFSAAPLRGNPVAVVHEAEGRLGPDAGESRELPGQLIDGRPVAFQDRHGHFFPKQPIIQIGSDRIVGQGHANAAGGKVSGGALNRLPVPVSIGGECQSDVRGKTVPAGTDLSSCSITA